jgi:hypothetical protein
VLGVSTDRVKCRLVAATSSCRNPSHQRERPGCPFVSFPTRIRLFRIKKSGTSTFIDDTIAAGDHIGVSAISIAEMVYLIEKGRNSGQRPERPARQIYRFKPVPTVEPAHEANRPWELARDPVQLDAGKPGRGCGGIENNLTGGEGSTLSETDIWRRRR